MGKYRRPTKKNAERAIKLGWSKEAAERGYDIFERDNTGMLEISVIDDCYTSCSFGDEECARQAAKDGIKIIPIEELPKDFNRRYFGWIDTPENRAAIERETELINSAECKAIMLNNVANMYGFYFKKDDLGNLILSAKNTDGIWTAWIVYKVDTDTVSYDDTDTMNIWLYRTRPDLSADKLERFVNDVNEALRTNISIRELIDPEDWQEIAGVADADDDPRYMYGFVRVCNCYDYYTAYEAHVEYEKGFVDTNGKTDPDAPAIETFEEFCKEFEKGYGVSDHIQIARLKETPSGIYYDNEYVA